jgi:tetratricopeptide (TPR) repeat protein
VVIAVRVILAGFVGLAAAALTAHGASAGPRPVPPATEDRGDGPDFDVRFDYEVVDRFLKLAERGGATHEELAAWVRLPGNIELLRVGRSDGGLTPEILEEAAKVTLGGGAFPGPDVLGALRGGDWGVLRQILDRLREREPEIAGEAARAVGPYLPRGSVLPPLVVRYHLGGSWDGRTTDAVYVNLTLFHERGLESLRGIDALLIHELFHRAQGALLPGIDDWSSRQSALYTVLLRMQQEGIARRIESEWLRVRPQPAPLDQDHLIMYDDGLRRVHEHVAVLEAIIARVQAGDREGARLLAQQGFRAGGSLYAVGHAMAGAIETRGGAAALAETVGGGPLRFVRVYENALGPGETSILPVSLSPLVRDLEAGYGRDPVLASRLRRQGLTLLSQDKREEAASTLEQAVRLDPTDSTSAYNLACAEALRSRKHRAMKWLREAFARGFDNTRHAATDQDLETLRDRADFKRLLEAYARTAAPGEGEPARPRPDEPNGPEPSPPPGGPGG